MLPNIYKKKDEILLVHTPPAVEDDIESTYHLQSSSQSIHSQSTTNRPRAKSVASIKLKERGLDEIIPIQHAQSAEQKVEGTYLVEEPGNYVLVFGKCETLCVCYLDNKLQTNRLSTRQYIFKKYTQNVDLFSCIGRPSTW